jgi:iron(III) transport system ATP-binding protein
LVERAGRRVLGPLDLALEQGTWTLVVGPSGCGKTTLLYVIAGLLRPSAGTVALAGVPASSGARLFVPPERRSIGFVFQGAGAGLWPHLSARATLEFVLACRHVPRGVRRARSLELLERLGLAALSERRPGELSGGEAQRLALARALVIEPRLLLLDEPLGALDHSLRAAMAATLAEVHARLSPTILYVTHDPREVAAHATRTLALRGGRLEHEA